eukprot:m.479398 g.479398  ORF g.479398 m.479398 type:complete len:70 (-) comp21700_c0_seq10:941-1150(-)
MLTYLCRSRHLLRNNCKDAGCTWDLYKGARGKFIPSVVDGTHYAAVQNYFREKLQVAGYIQWAQHLESS